MWTAPRTWRWCSSTTPPRICTTGTAATSISRPTSSSRCPRPPARRPEGRTDDENRRHPDHDRDHGPRGVRRRGGGAVPARHPPLPKDPVDVNAAPGEHLEEEPQEERGPRGSRDTGSDEPSGGPVDRPAGGTDEDADTSVRPQEAQDPAAPDLQSGG